jgi:dTDP-4-amino-4,6-dideoxygalactose transaminase
VVHVPQRVFGERELDLVKQVLDTGMLSGLGGGQMTPRFEREFATAVGAQYGVAMNAAMSVLHSAVKVSGAGAGDEVICDPVVVFGAVATMYNNAIPVFVDVDPATHCMNPDLIEAKITERTKALIVTHLWGLPAQIDRIVEIARRHNVFVIEDCAHSLFASYKGKQTGTWGDVGSFSFQMSKQLGLGDGGMAVTNSEQVRDDLALNAGAPTFQAVAHALHWNYRMTETTAAIGVAQLERAAGYIAGLQAVAKMYNDAVAGCDWIAVPKPGPEATHTYHLWAATFRGDEKGITLGDFNDALARFECGVSVGYTGMAAYKHPLIAERLGYGKVCPLSCPLYGGANNQYPDGLCPVAEDLVPRILLAYTFGDEEAHKQSADRLHQAVQSLS